MEGGIHNAVAGAYGEAEHDRQLRRSVAALALPYGPRRLRVLRRYAHRRPPWCVVRSARRVRTYRLRFRPIANCTGNEKAVQRGQC